MGAAHRRSRPAGSRPNGQHLLRSDRIAAELVAQAGVGAGDLVFEIGSGRGRITDALVRSGARVVAVELDTAFAGSLRRRYGGSRGITIVQGDALQVPLPSEPFHAFGNIPFGVTTAILRRLLDDPNTPLVRADLIVQYEVARKRTSLRPSNLLALSWQPWWDLRVARQLPRSAFEPAPTVDAGLLSIMRRRPPLLAAAQRHEYLRLLRAGFRRADLPVHRALRGRLPARAWKRLGRERGLPSGAASRDLDVFDWVALCSVVLGSDANQG